MSSSIPDIQLTPEIQTLFEQILEQKLKERDEYYIGQIQAREEELEARRDCRGIYYFNVVTGLTREKKNFHCGGTTYTALGSRCGS